MSNKYISPEHAIRNIMEGETKTKVIFDILEPLIKKKKTNLPAVVEPKSNLPATTEKGNLPAVVEPKGNLPTKSNVDPRGEIPSFSTTSPKAPVEPQTQTKTQTVVEPQTQTQTQTAVQPQTQTVVEPQTQTKTQTAVQPQTQTKTQTKTQTAVEPQTQTKTKPQTKIGVRTPVPPVDTLPNSGRRNYDLGIVTPGQPLDNITGSVFGINDYLHRARPRMAELKANIKEDADKERSDIVNVPRPTSDRNKTMARNQQIKKKLIDENAKKKTVVKGAIDDAKYSKSVDMKPEYKTDKINEASVFTKSSSRKSSEPYNSNPLKAIDAFGRSAANELTFKSSEPNGFAGGANYLSAGSDYALKNLGAAIGIGKGTTFDKELKQELEKDEIAAKEHPTATALGQVAPYALGGAGLAKAGVAGAIRSGMSPTTLNVAKTFGKKLIPGTVETYFGKSGAEDTAKNLSKGDYTGAVISGLQTAPVLGTVNKVAKMGTAAEKSASKLDTGLNMVGASADAASVQKDPEIKKQISDFASEIKNDPYGTASTIGQNIKEIPSAIYQHFFPQTNKNQQPPKK